MQGHSATNHRGVDVSEFQGIIDWPTVVRAGYTHNTIRSSYGTTRVDALFAKNWPAAKKAGATVRPYHYGVPSVGDAKRQAGFFWAQVQRAGGLAPNDGAPVLDLEETGGVDDAALALWAQTFCAELDTLIGNASQRTVVYSYAAFIAEHPQTFAALSDRGVWIAAIGVDAPPNVGPYTAWEGWQYSDQGRVPGIATVVDLDEWVPQASVAPAVTLTPDVTALQQQVTQLQNDLVTKDHTIAQLKLDMAHAVAELKGAK